MIRQHRALRLTAALSMVSVITCLSACSESSNNVPVQSQQSSPPQTAIDSATATASSNTQSTLHRYETIRREEVSDNRLVYHLRLEFADRDRLPSKDELGAISRHLRNMNPEFQSLFVYFYMRGYDSERHPPFAGAHHVLDAEMVVDIHTQPVPPSQESDKYGLTETERKQLYRELISLDRLSLEWDNDDRLEPERLRICKKYEIQENAYWQIVDEGSRKGWPSPEP